MKANFSPLLAGIALSDFMTLEDGKVSADSELGSVGRDGGSETEGELCEDLEQDERAIRDALLDELEELDREIEMQSIKLNRNKGWVMY